MHCSLKEIIQEVVFLKQCYFSIIYAIIVFVNSFLFLYFHFNLSS